MVKLLGKPLLEWIVEWLKAYGITNIIIGVAYHKESIIDHFGDGSNFGVNIKYSVHSVEGEKTTRINMREAAPLPDGFISLGEFNFKTGQAAAVVIATDDAGGTVHADAIQILPAK